MSELIPDRCGTCGGHGIVSDYSGGDFNGPKDCPDCAGGTIYISPRDRVFLWPGGPLAGSWPGRYQELQQIAQERADRDAEQRSLRGLSEAERERI